MDSRCKDCSNVPRGEMCICIGCGNQYFDKYDCCLCAEPCEAFDAMQDRSRLQAVGGFNEDDTSRI